MSQTPPHATTPITRTAEIEVFSNRFGTLFDDETVGPTGTPGRYLRWRWSGRGVVVVPVLDGRVGMWRMFRYPVGLVSLEFPRGSVEADESVEAGGLRELREETGLTASNAKILGSLHAESGLIESDVQVMSAEVESVAGPRGVEPMESIHSEPVWLDREQVSRLLRRRELTCAVTVTAWAMYLSHSS